MHRDQSGWVTKSHDESLRVKMNKHWPQWIVMTHHDSWGILNNSSKQLVLTHESWVIISHWWIAQGLSAFDRTHLRKIFLATFNSSSSVFRQSHHVEKYRNFRHQPWHLDKILFLDKKYLDTSLGSESVSVRPEVILSMTVIFKNLKESRDFA